MSVVVAQDSSRYQQLLMERIPSMLAYWDADLRCRFANRAYEKWFGVSPVSLLGTSLRDLLGPQLFALNEPHIRAVLQGHEQTFERSIPGPGGIIRQSLANYLPDIVDGAVVGFLAHVTDVTPLKAAQAALQRSEEYLRELLGLATEGVVVADRNGHYIDVNAACCGLLGCTREELLGKTFEDLLCPAELERLPEARARFRAGEHLVEEWTLQRKDGSVVPVEVRAKLLPDGRRVGFLRDITEHKRLLAAEHGIAEELERRVRVRTEELEQAWRALQLSHESLRTSEHRYRTLIDWSPVAIAVHREGRLVYVNPAAVELFDAGSAVELLGKSILELIQPDFHRFVQERVRSASTQGAPSTVAEVGLVTLKGAKIDALIQGAPILFDNQPSMLASIRDVTPAKRADIALRKSEARLRGIFAAATDAILTVNESQRIVEANPAAAAMLRLPLDALIGAPLERFIPEPVRARHGQMVKAFGDEMVSARPMGPARTVTGVRATGEEFPIDAAISHLNVDGLRQYTVILRDITERQLAETALRESEASLRRLLALLPEAVVVTSDDRITFVNRAAERLLGADESALLGRLSRELFDPESLAVDRSRVIALQAGTAVAPVVEERVMRPDGDIRIVETIATLIDDRGGSSILAVMRDVTELMETRSALMASRQVEEDLHRLARLDPLTGLANRRLFGERLTEALARAQRSERPLVLMLLDVDNFKAINDTYGHRAGDEVLNEFARRLQQCVRATDTVARMGGDEFAMVLEESHGVD